MCLALPGKIVEKNGNHGVIDFAGNRHKVNLVMVPEVEVGSYALVHAGYAIQIVDEEHAREAWSIVEESSE